MNSQILACQLASPPDEFLRLSAPLIATEEVPACSVCAGTKFSSFARGFDYELLTCANHWNFVQCSGCGHVWLNPRPAVAELGVIYPPTYYAYNYDQINPIARKAKEFLDRRKMQSIVRHCSQPPKSYLDVGCGNGRFLKVMEHSGVAKDRLFGLELDQTVVSHLGSEGYSGVACARVEDASHIPDGSVDLATMFHVIEHVADPAAVVARIRRWLSPGGIFALETPNLDSLDARLFRKSYWGGYHTPRHWHLFTPSTISLLLAENGLEVSTIAFQTGHSFWMYSLHHAIRYGEKPRPHLGQFFNPLKSLFNLAAFTAFDLFRGALGAKTSAMLVICKKPHSSK